MLRFSNIVKSYTTGGTQVNALKGVQASIEKGATIALCGPSGSGKSTLLNICGLLDPEYQGDIFLDNKKVPTSRKALTKLRREKLGFIFQQYNLIPVMTAFENIEYPLLMLGWDQKLRKQKVMDMITSVGLEEHAHKRPDQLSGGQQQRVAIARALVKEPALVIADEPTANLDTETAYLIIDLMRELGHKFGSTFLIATHDNRMTESCDRVLILSDGVICEQTSETDKKTSFKREMLCAG